MAETHTTLAAHDRVNGVTPAGLVVRTGTFLRFQDRANTLAPGGPRIRGRGPLGRRRLRLPRLLRPPRPCLTA